MTANFQVECEPTNRSAGPTKTLKFLKAIVNEKGLIVAASLTGEFYTVRLIQGLDRFIAPARAIAIKKNRTELTWLRLLDSDREHLAQILIENQKRSPVLAAPETANN